MQKGGMEMATTGCAFIPESTRQSLLAATYMIARDFFQDPDVRAEYEEWLAKRKAALKAAE